MIRLRLVHLAVLMAVISMGLTFFSKLQAQTLSSTAALSGTISDPSGARVAKATTPLKRPHRGSSLQS